MSEKLIIKHNFKGALFLGSAVAISLLIIVGLPKGFGLPYIKDMPFILLLFLVVCIGIYVIWTNYSLRKIVVTGNECIYINIWGHKKYFCLDNLKIVFKDSENVLFYDKQGKKICKIEAYMDNLDEFADYVCLINNDAISLKEDELEKKLSCKYKELINCLQTFFLEKKVGVVLEYGLQIELYERTVVYVVIFRVKNEKGYLGQNFLQVANWEYKFRLYAYDREKQLLYCENNLEKYLEKMYKQLIQIVKGNNVVKKDNVTLLKMQEQLNV